MYNNSYDVISFSIPTVQPFPGCFIEPTSGVIPGNAYQRLDIRCQIPSCVDFEAVVSIAFSRGKFKQFHIKGSVGMPKVMYYRNTLI